MGIFANVAGRTHGYFGCHRQRYIVFYRRIFHFLGLIKKQDIYENFIDGAKKGFEIAITIIPYLVAMLTAIAVFRASGMFDLLLLVIEKGFTALGVDTAFRQWGAGNDD